jgi:hypothetical protein
MTREMANSLSSSVRKLAVSRLLGSMRAERPTAMVMRPSTRKMYLQVRRIPVGGMEERP